MLEEGFEIIGFWENDIYFFFEEKLVIINKKLPKEDLVLKLKVQPEDVKALRDEVLVQASRKPLTYQQKQELYRGKK
jgi:hypothetical protein